MLVVAALYKFVSLKNYQELQKPLSDFCRSNGIKGTLLLASEGINGTVSGTREAIDRLVSYLKNDLFINDIEYKESFADKHPFFRLKIRLKKEIVTLAQPDVNPNVKVGTYVDPQDWNDLIRDPNVLLIDTRNDYEVKIGTFKNAIDPKTQCFTEFPDYVSQNLDKTKHKKVAMFCTGGIRCEKASSYMLSQGFNEVYHLKGGILKYLETVPAEESLWEGECFVFDQRVAVKQGLEQGSYHQCHGCRMPISEADQNSPYFEKGVSCPNCYDTMPEKTKQRVRERQRQIEIAASRNQAHLGDGARLERNRVR
jgi:UPF0176 protein